MDKEYKSGDVLHDEAVNIPQHLDDETGVSSVRRAQVEKRLKLKLDLRFSILIVIYILNYMWVALPVSKGVSLTSLASSSDRNNAGQARLRGFEADLKLKGQEFATLLSILYVVGCGEALEPEVTLMINPEIQGYILMQASVSDLGRTCVNRSKQIPSNMIIQKIRRPSWYIAGAMMIWGAIS